MRLIAILSLLSAGALSAKVDFTRDVRPILSDKCFQCHGPDDAARKANLRFDDKDSMARVLKSGDAAASKLYQRISHEKKALRMPPPYSGMSLTDTEIQVLKQWISEGAEWRNHWAYVPPQRIEPPAVANREWSQNPVDRFLFARLRREGLKPSPPAGKTTLLRRVTFDLTGLPPTEAEIDQFLKDRSPDAYTKVVDRLLASPHYGERMAMQWMDLARYADTHGYHIDSHRDMWPWRDWVISAFNRNMPFDQFTVWQLAGDLLPNATREQRIATGFHRNHMINFEGGAIAEEYQAQYVADRVETTATVFLGTTLGCARCHDHKYDPLRQKDFYRMAAFFNTVPEKGLDGQKGNAQPFLALPDEAQKERLDKLKSAIAGRADILDPFDVAVAQAIWERTQFDTVQPAAPRQGLTACYELDGSLGDSAGRFLNARLLQGDLNCAAAGIVHRAADVDSSDRIRIPAEALDAGKPFTMAFWFRIGRQKAAKAFQQIAGGAGFEVGFGTPETLPRLRRGHHLEIRWFDAQGRELLLRSGDWILQGEVYHAAISSDGRTVSLHLNGQPAKLIEAASTLSAPLSVQAPIEINSEKHGGFFRGRLDDLRFYSKPLSAEDLDLLAVRYPAEVLLATPGKRTREQWQRLNAYYLKHAAGPAWRTAAAELEKLDEERVELESEIPTTMVMAEMEKPRDTFVLGRGDYQNKGEKVTPGVPPVLPPLPAGVKADRLALARWIVAPENPLTARVTVNRYWQALFGYGIVKTSEDFGSQGEQPVHPELLDFLAAEFVRSGWDVKALHRLLVTSAAYRQSSNVTPAPREKDPENRLLARGPRFRLPAEMIRDNALAVSGLLKDNIGGPSVLPYQPAGLWEELAFGEAFSAQEYRQDHGDKLYRRAMYTFWKRTAPPASLNTFDAPDREKCIARRAVTNTPLQALVTLNDPTYIEAARSLARHALRQPGGDGARLQWAFRRATARRPSASELKVLRSLLRSQSETYSKDSASAASLLEIGESPVDAQASPAALAAWTNVCTVLLNLDETITKE